jgi:hypothetical protein
MNEKNKKRGREKVQKKKKKIEEKSPKKQLKEFHSSQRKSTITITSFSSLLFPLTQPNTHLHPQHNNLTRTCVVLHGKGRRKKKGDYGGVKKNIG